MVHHRQQLDSCGTNFSPNMTACCNERNAAELSNCNNRMKDFLQLPHDLMYGETLPCVRKYHGSDCLICSRWQDAGPMASGPKAVKRGTCAAAAAGFGALGSTPAALRNSAAKESHPAGSSPNTIPSHSTCPSPLPFQSPAPRLSPLHIRPPWPLQSRLSTPKSAPTRRWIISARPVRPATPPFAPSVPGSAAQPHWTPPSYCAAFNRTSNSSIPPVSTHQSLLIYPHELPRPLR